MKHGALLAKRERWIEGRLRPEDVSLADGHKEARRARLRRTLNAALEKRREKMAQVKMQPQLRYDEVYYEGMAWLDGEGVQPKMDEVDCGLDHVPWEAESQYRPEPENDEPPYIYTCGYCGAQMTGNLASHRCPGMGEPDHADEVTVYDSAGREYSKADGLRFAFFSAHRRVVEPVAALSE